MKLSNYGTVEVTAAASDKVSVYSSDRVKLYKKVTYANYPAGWVLLYDVAPNTEYTSSAFSVPTDVKIEAGGADVFYAVGTAPALIEIRGKRVQPTPGALNATGTLTAALIGGGIVTSTTAAAVTATLDTGTVMDAALQMEIGDSFDWSAINTGGTNAFTVTAAASGHTVVGAGAVANSTTGLFRTRKTAAATFITYRIG